jgi:endonuclease/exonuclease/phosphatase family metal-dependent hydrolase
VTPARWRLVSVALVLLALSGSVPWAFGYLLPQRGTRAIGLAGLAGYSAFAVVAVVVLAWALRRWAALAVVGVLLVAQSVTVGPAYIGDGQVPAHSTVLRVMTANLYFGTADVAQVAALVRDRRVDVLALEELSPDAVARLEQAGLRTELPYAIDHSALGAAGTGLWSRLPMTEVAAAPAGFNVAAADLVLGNGRIRVRAFHPVTPLPTAARWRRSYAVMRAQIQDDRDVATLLLGDFNATVHHRELRHLMGTRWRDAAEADGAGLVRTWSPHSRVPALLDLDHVLIDRGMTVGSFATVPIHGSDHHAVIVAVGLPGRT